MKKRFFAKLSLIATLCLVIVVPYAFADVALTISPSNRGDDLNFDTNYGWQFTLKAAVSVTDVGIWDVFARFGPDTPGLNESHLVTIWDSANNPVAQGVVPAGTNNTLVDVFRYAPLPAPVLLQPGTYTISAYYSGTSGFDHVAFFADPIVTSPYLSYNNGMLWFGSGPPAPYAPDQNNGYFGPNFQFQPVGKLVLPLVSVSVSPNKVTRNGQTTFTVSRSFADSSDMTVKIAISGSAEMDVDYFLDSLSDRVFIPGGETSTTVTLTAITTKTTGHENVVMTLLPDIYYSLSKANGGPKASQASVKIENKKSD
jgi:hypothetical protein